MIFCQACGARNADDARYCNMCGARIARSGEPGGPILPGGTVGQAHAAPAHAPASTTMGGARISLEAIGVRSSARTWAMLIGAALAFAALGALGTWIAMRGSAPAPGSSESAREAPLPEPPIEVGEPEPVGASMPQGVDVAPGVPPPVAAAKRTSLQGAPRGTASGIAGGERTETRAGGASAPSGTGPAASHTGSGDERASAGERGSGAERASAGERGSGGAEASAAPVPPGGEPAIEPAPAGPGARSEPGTGPTRDWEAMQRDLGPSPEDVAMQSYSSHVRRVIREFYVRRAQSCFEHETRVDGAPVRGTVLIGFTIQESGEVTDASVVRDTTGREALAACLARQVDAWRLPPPPTELGAVEMQMPFSR